MKYSNVKVFFIILKTITFSNENICVVEVLQLMKNYACNLVCVELMCSKNGAETYSYKVVLKFYI